MPAKPKKQKVAFTLTAPQAQTVLLAGEFTEWEKSPVALKKSKNGEWKGTISLAPGAYEYRFVVDGEWQDDPACTTRRWNRFGTENCVREVVEAASA